jgi:hypothetical protein
MIGEQLNLPEGTFLDTATVHVLPSPRSNAGMNCTLRAVSRSLGSGQTLQ